MTSKFITVNNLKITFLEVNPDAKNTIFFIHGNSGSSRTWLKQLNDPLLKNYRMIAFDLPAHGGSSASTDLDNDYNLPAMGKLVADAVAVIGSADNFILAGFSLGSNVLAEALNWIKPTGIVLTGGSAAGGNYTMDKVFQPGVDSTVFFSDAASTESINNFAADISCNPTEADKHITIEDYNRVKPGFRPTFIKTVMEGKMSDEIALLTQYGLPALVIFGLDDKMVNPDYLNDAPFSLWQNKVFQLSEAGHAAHVDQPAIFNKLLLEYVEERID